MAHKKAAGTAKNLRDSQGQRLGIKKFGGQVVLAGNIICRQRGTKWEPGVGVSIGKDHTIYATQDGFVKFTQKRRLRFDGRIYRKTYIHVVDEPENSKKGAHTVKSKPVKAVKKVAEEKELKAVTAQETVVSEKKEGAKPVKKTTSATAQKKTSTTVKKKTTPKKTVAKKTVAKKTSSTKKKES